MIKDLVLWTCSGGMKIVYLSQFAKMVQHCIVEQPIVEVALGEVPERAFWDHQANSEFVMPPVAAYKRETHELKPFHEVDAEEIQRKHRQHNAFTHAMREQVSEKAFGLIEDEFKIMVAQKAPTFFMKDLSMQNVEKLSEEYAKQMGSDACGINVTLSHYQRFFVIADPQDFRFYMCQIQKHDITRSPYAITQFRGKLVDMRPEKWQMGRYENLTYMHELNAMQRYVPTTGGSSESR